MDLKGGRDKSPCSLNITFNCLAEPDHSASIPLHPVPPDSVKGHKCGRNPREEAVAREVSDAHSPVGPVNQASSWEKNGAQKADCGHCKRSQ